MVEWRWQREKSEFEGRSIETIHLKERKNKKNWQLQRHVEYNREIFDPCVIGFQKKTESKWVRKNIWRNYAPNFPQFNVRHKFTDLRSFVKQTREIWRK